MADEPYHCYKKEQKQMIDFHSHFLPQIDDGSKSVEESLTLLQTSRAQGVTTMVATPHFYAEQNTPDRFLERRRRAWARLAPAYKSYEGELPEILFGAEVHYFEGIARTDETLKLRCEGTRILLLEMPFSCWNDRMLDEIVELNRNPEIQVLLAHIERYLTWQKRSTVADLIDEGILIQSNAENFLSWPQNRKGLKMVKEKQIHVISSDCHNMEKRPPNIGAARDVIIKKAGRSIWTRLERNGKNLLRTAALGSEETQQK